MTFSASSQQLVKGHKRFKSKRKRESTVFWVRGWGLVVVVGGASLLNCLAQDSDVVFQLRRWFSVGSGSEVWSGAPQGSGPVVLRQLTNGFRYGWQNLGCPGHFVKKQQWCSKKGSFKPISSHTGWGKGGRGTGDYCPLLRFIWWRHQRGRKLQRVKFEFQLSYFLHLCQFSGLPLCSLLLFCSWLYWSGDESQLLLIINHRATAAWLPPVSTVTF